MKKYFYLLVCIAFFYTKTNGQGVAINTDGSVADNSALLDLKSSVKGMLAPRMTVLEKTAIGSPATGLIIYQTDAITGLYYNDGTPLVPNWIRLTTDKTAIAFSATTTVAQVFGSAAFIKVQYPTEEYDESGNFVPGVTSEFTAPSTGVYHFDALSGISAPPNTFNYISVFVNAVQKKTVFDNSPSSNTSLQINTDLKLNAGDIVDIRLSLQSGGTQLGGFATFTWFNGRKIN